MNKILVNNITVNLKYYYLSSKHRLTRYLVSFCFLLIQFSPITSFAEIQFEEKTIFSEINYSSTTFGASWGDFNSDGWPDIWIGNHVDSPHLYLNLGNGKFEQIIHQVWSEKPKIDTHGAAWADFDNDGDQDLFEIVGGANLGGEPNHLFINENGKLTNHATQLGVDYASGRGRTPLWFDADRDGLLDILLMNMSRAGDNSQSLIFKQTEKGFVEHTDVLKMQIHNPSFIDKITNKLYTIFGIESPHKSIYAHPRNSFAQLADVSGDSYLDLLTYSYPLKIYSIDNVPFKEISNRFNFPAISQAQDIAVEDFNNDGKLDMFLVRNRARHPNAILTTPNELKAFIKILSKKRATSGISFKSKGKAEFTIYPPWLDPITPDQDTPIIPPDVYVGSRKLPPGELQFTLSPEDLQTTEIQQEKISNENYIFINYDSDNEKWSLMSSSEISLVVRTSQTIDALETIGFKASTGAQTDQLLLQKNHIFQIAAFPDQATTCHSVVSGDFDNDMDLDLYLVCADPINNTPNRLYENNGQGQFKVVINAGGATGTLSGRGDVVVTADYDRDGFLDLFLTNGLGSPPFAIGPYQLFRNQGNLNHWLEIDLEGTTSNRDGIGALVSIEASGHVQMRSQTNGMHRYAQNHSRLHFGLGQNKIITRLTVQWPSGIVQHLHNIAADQLIKITESSNSP